MSRSPLAGDRGIVTGGSSGIGRAVAEALAARGARLALVARGARALADAASSVGGVALAADVADPAQVAGLPARFRDAFGAAAPAFLVHGAGTFSLAPLAETSPAEFRAAIDTNLLGSFLVLRAFLPAMLEARRGRIVLMGSVAGRRAFAGNAAYAASKYGLRGLFEVLALETAGTGVACTLVEPGATDTPLWDGRDGPGLPRREDMLAAADVAEAVAWLLERPARVRIPFLPIGRPGAAPSGA